MARGIRFTETVFNRGLWVVAILFAYFLVALGSLVVRDLPRVDNAVTLERYVDQTKARPLDVQIKSINQELTELNRQAEPLQKQVNSAGNATRAEQDSFNNWVQTREVTGKSDQDPEVIARTRKLDNLREAERAPEAKLDAVKQNIADLNARLSGVQSQRTALEDAAQSQLQSALRAQQLRVFLYRLAITLPLLAIAGWLFKAMRKHRYWPFVWGFIFFALFTFFFELVPYLPNYGGYVRYIVGIIVTLVVGRYAINGLQRYLERQKIEEAKPDIKRREELNYDVVLGRMSKKVCPGCERPYKYEDEANNFCTHCGICVFDHCTSCKTRKNAFSRFCHSCGVVATVAEVTTK